MRRAGKIGLAASAVLAAGVVTGGMLAVGQELSVDDNPGEPLTLEGVETGVAAQDASSGVSGARIRAEGTTPKVEEPVVVVQQPVVDEVPPADPVVIAPRRAAPAPAPAPAPPAPHHHEKKADEPKHEWGKWPSWGDGDRDGDRDGKGDGGGHHGGGGHDKRGR